MNFGRPAPLPMKTASNPSSSSNESMPDSMSIERRKMLALLGAEIVLTPATRGMTGAVARAEELEALGLVLESFGPGAVLVRETPALLGETDVSGLVRDTYEETRPA